MQYMPTITLKKIMAPTAGHGLIHSTTAHLRAMSICPHFTLLSCALTRSVLAYRLDQEIRLEKRSLASEDLEAMQDHVTSLTPEQRTSLFHSIGLGMRYAEARDEVEMGPAFRHAVLRNWKVRRSLWKSTRSSYVKRLHLYLSGYQKGLYGGSYAKTKCVML